MIRLVSGGHIQPLKHVICFKVGLPMYPIGKVEGGSTHVTTPQKDFTKGDRGETRFSDRREVSPRKRVKCVFGFYPIVTGTDL